MLKSTKPRKDKELSSCTKCVFIRGKVKKLTEKRRYLENAENKKRQIFRPKWAKIKIVVVMLYLLLENKNKDIGLHYR